MFKLAACEPNAALLAVLALAFLAAPAAAIECGDEMQNCDALAYCQNITVDGTWVPTCVCPEGTIGSEDRRDNTPPFTSGTCNKDLWTVRYVKEATAWGEWRTCAGGATNGNPNHGRDHCHECTGQLRYGRDDPTAANYPGPWWTISEKPLPETAADFDCSAAWFDVDGTDPYPGEFKACDCRELVELPSDKWSKCAEEHGSCTCDGTVLYGSDLFERGYAIYETTGEEDVSCSNSNPNFGDPDHGQYKACYCFAGVSRTFMSEYGYGGSVLSPDTGYGMCEAGAGGYYFRKLGETLEVNCLYDNKTLAEEESPAYADESYLTTPRVYRWVLPTTAEPLEIPPTGLEVESVEFDTTCADSGCWVLRGIMTSGEAFNDFSAFNTFYLPQAVGDDQASFDFDYSASGSNVAWTFQPANAPCSSVDYEAGETPTTFKISYCCISEPTVGPTDVAAQTGGFIANYRPTKNFVAWVGEKYEACDLKFTTADGGTKCWKALDRSQKDTWDQASARCVVAGGTLPSVTNATENALLLQLKRDFNFGGIWLGARDRNSEGDFHWSDGSAGPGEPGDTDGEYENWGANEPNDVNYGAFREDCIEMHGDGRWNDQSCAQQGSILSYFCQFDAEDVCTNAVIQRPKYSAPPTVGSVPCWDVKHEAKTYADAASSCAGQGGALAKVDTPEKFHLMKRMLDSVAPGQNVEDAWIGLDDVDAEGVFVWAVDNSTIEDIPGAYPFMGWRTNQRNELPSGVRGWPMSWTPNPTDPEFDGKLLDCVMVRKLGRWWEDVACSEVSKFICEVPRSEGQTCDSDMPNVDPLWNIPFPVNYDNFMIGPFKGMDTSPGVVKFENVDPYFGQFRFEIRLDEVELRRNAGQLRGTVGVEHTVDTFLGLTNFRPTGLANGVIDTFSTQTAIHLEKTSFFSVSTHGTNQYTFLEYVNMRLVSVYNQDVDFSGNNAARTERTAASDNANYLQVTFTLGTQYTVNNNPNADPFSSGLIPLDSVRAGRGTFLDEVESTLPSGMEHVCSEYAAAADADDIGLALGRVSKSTFDAQIAQDCGPKSTMCASPASIPDNFVSFNIPLGKEIFEDPRADLSNNVFVSMVVNALEPSAGPEPNSGDAPLQMKTTLTASIPIVQGGINIFCDGVTAKTDLKDVANADIIVGTAASAEELTRLRLVEDVASTELQKDLSPNVVDSASIESGLLTLVLKGNASYFAPAGASSANTLQYSLELDDLITIHMMEEGSAATSTKEAGVTALLNAPAEDNSDTNGLLTEGYKLNGAFYFTVNRGNAGNPGNTVAQLEPTPELLQLCPFNPARPAVTSVPLETCITRRDVKQRRYPKRVGADFPTAMEIFNSNILEGGDAASVSSWSLAEEQAWIANQIADASSKPCPAAAAPASGTVAEWGDEGYGCEAGFMTSILADDEYSRQLAKDFVGAIRTRYALNGRYTRAFWINPGYEWTPTQTGGASRFTISQKVFLFALITIDENWTRRRMLLQADTAADPTEDSGSGLAASRYQFNVSPRSLMASVFKSSEDRVAVFAVTVQLSAAQACMELDQLQASLQASLADSLAATASAFNSVQVTGVSRSLNGVACARRVALRRALLASEALTPATADLSMMVIFAAGATDPTFNPAAFQALPAVAAVTPSALNAPSIQLDSDFVCDPATRACGLKDIVGTGDGDGDGDGDSSSIALIAGIAGGVGGALLIAFGGLVLLRRQSVPTVTAEAVQVVDVNRLKAELAASDNA